MVKFPFRVLPKRSLGVDIGTWAIRIVELSEWKGRIRLENYGEIKTLLLSEKPFKMFKRSALLLPAHRTGESLKELLKKAGVKSKGVSFSIPDFSTFFTAIDFPSMGKKELEDAVRYEARRHIPLPLSEVVLDWQLINKKVPPEKEKKEGKEGKEGKVRVLLVAVPKEVIGQYQGTAEAAQLELFSLEAEVFSLIRALRGDLAKISALIEIGAQSTTVSIIEGEELKTTHSFDVSGNELTQTLSRSLEIGYEEAEVLKKIKGIKSEGSVKEVLMPLIDLILTETKRVLENFVKEEERKVEKLILAGGTALLPGLKEYFSKQLGKEIILANPFKEFFYPAILEETLKDIGPTFAIATGIAKRALE